MTLAASLFAGVASLVSSADNNSLGPDIKKEESTEGPVIDFNDLPNNSDSVSTEVPGNRPEDPKTANPNIVDVPTPETPKPNKTKQSEVKVVGAEKAPSSTDKKEAKKADEPAVKKVLPKTSAVK